MKEYPQQLPLALFLLRVGVVIVMGMWAIDKFANPDHTAKVFETFYFIPNLSAAASYGLGLIQGAIVILFAVGLYKKYSYGAVFVMHLISTLSSYDRYFNPWELPNLLFFAAWPMLAAIAALYLLREDDTLLCLGSKA